MILLAVETFFIVFGGLSVLAFLAVKLSAWWESRRKDLPDREEDEMTR